MTAKNVSESLLKDLALYAPDVVFLHIGGNDIRKTVLAQLYVRIFAALSK